MKIEAKQITRVKEQEAISRTCFLTFCIFSEGQWREETQRHLGEPREEITSVVMWHLCGGSGIAGPTGSHKPGRT